MMSITTDAEGSTCKTFIKYISLTLSVMSFLFSVSRDYLNYSRKFQSHNLISKLYTTLLRSTSVRLIKTRLEEAEKRDIFKDIDNKVRMERDLLEL
jgi:hypothetical protein